MSGGALVGNAVQWRNLGKWEAGAKCRSWILFNEVDRIGDGITGTEMHEEDAIP